MRSERTRRRRRIEVSRDTSRAAWLVCASQNRNGTLSTLGCVCASAAGEDPCPSFGTMPTLLPSSSTDDTAAIRSTAIGGRASVTAGCVRVCRRSPRPRGSCRWLLGCSCDAWASHTPRRLSISITTRGHSLLRVPPPLSHPVAHLVAAETQRAPRASPSRRTASRRGICSDRPESHKTHRGSAANQVARVASPPDAANAPAAPVRQWRSWESGCAYENRSTLGNLLHALACWAALDQVPRDAGKPSHMSLLHLDSICSLLSSATELRTRSAA